METSRLTAWISAGQGRNIGTKGLLLMAVLLVPTVFYSFLLFHTLVELFAVVVAVLVAVVGWQTYSFSRNDFLMFLAIGFFWVGALDLLHTVTYRGLAIVPGDDPDVATQLWVVARYLQAAILFLAPWYISRRLRPGAAFAVIGALAAVASLMIFIGRFPTAFSPESGLTPFKIWSEYVIIGLLLLAVANLWRHREELDTEVFQLIVGAILITILSEFMFTLYHRVDGPESFLGHLGKLAAFWLVFVAVVDTTLKTPFRMLARRVSTYDAVPDPTVVVDPDGVVRQVNRAAVDLVGGNGSVASGDYHSLFHPSQWSATECPVCRAIRGGIEEPISFEVEFEENGSWQAITLSPLQFSDSGYSGVVHVSHDITQRKAAEQELQKRNEELSSILNSVGEGIFGVDQEGRATFANLALERMTGWDAASLIGRDIHATLHEAHGSDGTDSAAECPVHQTLTDGRTHWSDYDRYHRRDGTEFPVEFTSAPMRGSDGKTAGAVVVVRDITQRKQAEEALLESEQRYRTLMENANDAIVVTTTEGRILDANPRAEALTGYTIEELQQLSAADILGREQGEREAVQRELEAVGRTLYEHTVTRKEGTLLPVEVSVARFQVNGNVLQASSLRDISERKRLEAERRRHGRELERKVAERTRELQAVNRELESFSYSVSHDLRAPLRAINGFGQILAEEYAGSLDDEGRGYLERMENAAKRMSQMVDGLLGLSRVIRREMHVETIDLSALAGEVAELVAGAEPERPVDWRIAPDLSVTGDPTLVRLLLQNLLENAWKFTAGRDPAVIEVGRKDLPDGTAYYVRDNGAGFDPESAEELFKPFTRLHAADDYAGSGIGLATVQRIARRHGGRSWAEGSPGEGATIYFTLAPAGESGDESSNM